jgi:hypothetical protein
MPGLAATEDAPGGQRRCGFIVARWPGDGITPDAYRALEAGEPIHDFETWDRICKLYGWSRTFVGQG